MPCLGEQQEPVTVRTTGTGHDAPLSARGIDESPRALAWRSSHGRIERVKGDGGHLALRFLTPAAPDEWPVVIVVHGLRESKESLSNLAIAEGLIDAGFAVVLFDLSGHGESTAKGRTVDDFADDLGAVAEWVSAQPELDTHRVGVTGSNFGGLAVACAIQRDLIQPRAVVLLAPPLDAETLRRLSCHTLVIAGENDPLQVQIRRVLGATPEVAFVPVAHSGHLFGEPGALDQATDMTVAWFRKHLSS